MGRLLRRVLSGRLRAVDGHLSRDYVAAALQRSTRELGEQPQRSLSDLAPGEVYRADRVTPVAGGLLHHRFTLTAAPEGTRRSVFCGTVSRVAPGGCYPPPCSVEPGRSSADRRSGPTRPSCRPIRLRSYRCTPQRPDSSLRMRMALLSGHSTTSSGAARRMTARSDSLSFTLLPIDTPRTSSAAPIP